MQGELGQQQLVERQAAASPLEVGLTGGEVARRQRRAPGRAVARLVRSEAGQRLDHVAQRGGVPADQGQDLGRGQALAGRVVSDRVAAGDRLVGARVGPEPRTRLRAW